MSAAATRGATGLGVVEKIWARHVVAEPAAGTALVQIDRVLLHDRGGGLTLRKLTDAGRRVVRPAAVVATADHVVDTRPGRTGAGEVPGGEVLLAELRAGTHRHGLRLLDVGDPGQGIVHVISPEQGIALPGLTLVCNDSHTGTVGGIGALAWGVGTTELEQALATGCLLMAPPRPMRVELIGTRPPAVTAKDVALHLAGVLGDDGAAGCTVEFTGAVVTGMSVEERLTLCNLATELSARTAVVAPDDTTIEYVARTPLAPQGELWDAAVTDWTALRSDPDAGYERTATVDCGGLEPQVTWGTSPAQVVGVHGRVPAGPRRALSYMGLRPGQPLLGLPITGAFIGSCTNARISDLRAAAAVLRGRSVAPGVRAICVPGSGAVRRQAEAEGLDAVFRAAGFSWREAGCAMCFHAGGESFAGQRVVTSTNRNFEHRQGASARSHLASPATVAASAVAGAIADPRVP
ncbi:3-isopropylmalate dehydratase large subunit [Actinomycetes bacterium KLBMP 9759]